MIYIALVIILITGIVLVLLDSERTISSIAEEIPNSRKRPTKLYNEKIRKSKDNLKILGINTKKRRVVIEIHNNPERYSNIIEKCRRWALAWHEIYRGEAPPNDDDFLYRMILWHTYCGIKSDLDTTVILLMAKKTNYYWRLLCKNRGNRK